MLCAPYRYRSGCPFCKNAKGLLADLGADFTALELDTLGADGKAIRAELAEVRGRFVTLQSNVICGGGASVLLTANSKACCGCSDTVGSGSKSPAGMCGQMLSYNERLLQATVILCAVL